MKSTAAYGGGYRLYLCTLYLICSPGSLSSGQGETHPNFHPLNGLGCGSPRPSQPEMQWQHGKGVDSLPAYMTIRQQTNSRSDTENDKRCTEAVHTEKHHTTLETIITSSQCNMHVYSNIPQVFVKNNCQLCKH